MKTIVFAAMAVTLFPATLMAEEVVSYINYIRQFQAPSGVVWDNQTGVEAIGTMASALAIKEGGATFMLGTIKSSSLTADLTSYHLATRTVGTVPLGTIVVRSKDTSSVVPRTRADQPFWVDVTVAGIQTESEFPEAKQVTFLHHVQSYGEGGTGVGIDTTQATLLDQSTIDTMGTQNLTFEINMVPGAVRTKVRGEERFSLFSVKGPNLPASELTSQRIQIWPVADATLSGLAQNAVIRFSMPPVTVALNDLYPLSTTYVQVYQGEARLGESGTILPTALITAGAVPENAVLKLENYDKSFTKDGRWTMEVLTSTPFGIDRLAHVSFTLDRTIEVNSTVTTVE